MDGYCPIRQFREHGEEGQDRVEKMLKIHPLHMLKRPLLLLQRHVPFDPVFHK